MFELHGISKALVGTLVALILSSATPTAEAQQRNANRQQSSVDTDVVKVYHLKFAEPYNVAPVIQKLKFPARVAVEPATNALVVKAAPATLAVVEELLESLDHAPTESTSGTTSVMLELKNRDAAEVARLIRAIYQHMPIVSDRTSRQIIIEASRTQLQKIRETVARLDQPESVFDLSFFFVKANTGKASSGTIDLPPNLLNVGQALQQGGFGNASLLAPLSARTRDSAHFTTSGFIGDPGGEGMVVEVSGEVQKGGDSNTARLAIAAEVHWIWGTERSQSVFAVETELLVQMGDYIVLAVAPSAGVADPALALVVRVDKR